MCTDTLKQLNICVAFIFAKKANIYTSFPAHTAADAMFVAVFAGAAVCLSERYSVTCTKRRKDAQTDYTGHANSVHSTTPLPFYRMNLYLSFGVLIKADTFRSMYMSVEGV